MNKNVKRLIKYTGILAGTIIVLAIGLYLIFVFPSTVSCPKFNAGYFAWLPYSEKQEIVFSDGYSSKAYIVETVNVHHTNSYQNNTKCGCCEDKVHVVMVSGKDRIEVTYDNFDNPENCLGEMVQVNFKNSYLEMQHPEVSPADKEFSVEGRVFFEKGKGIVRFIEGGKTWSLKSSKEPTSKPDISNGTGC
ncbi:hypothetical protein [Flavobacterium sp.]|uniref:hypothetical protein n=1 Tax=Flavobacterium sp. TaxID=239 RepID=UPI004034C306